MKKKKKISSGLVAVLRSRSLVKRGVTFYGEKLYIREVSWAVEINTDVLITPQQVSLEREMSLMGKRN